MMRCVMEILLMKKEEINYIIKRNQNNQKIETEVFKLQIVQNITRC